MIELRPYDDHAAFRVFSVLDPSDHREAELVRGAPATHLALFADWRGVEGARLLSLVAATGWNGSGEPFAVIGLGHTGQGGVAQAAMLARNHTRFRLQLAQLGLMIRRRMPDFCAGTGIRRIEARSWSDHPTAGAFLTACGFSLECAMPGFGPHGTTTFNQFAWTASEEP